MYGLMDGVFFTLFKKKNNLFCNGKHTWALLARETTGLLFYWCFFVFYYKMINVPVRIERPWQIKKRNKWIDAEIGGWQKHRSIQVMHTLYFYEYLSESPQCNTVNFRCPLQAVIWLPWQPASLPTCTAPKLKHYHELCLGKEWFTTLTHTHTNTEDQQQWLKSDSRRQKTS